MRGGDLRGANDNAGGQRTTPGAKRQRAGSNERAGGPKTPAGVTTTCRDKRGG